MPVQFEKNIVNFMPVTAAREMYEPFHKLKYSFAVPYYDQMRVMLPKMVKDKRPRRCARSTRTTSSASRWCAAPRRA